MAANELDKFLATWDREAQSTAKLLRALPSTQYKTSAPTQEADRSASSHGIWLKAMRI